MDPDAGNTDGSVRCIDLRCPCLPANCTQSGQTVTCTFGSTGAAQSWTAPDGVTTATVTLDGGQGGSAPAPFFPQQPGGQAATSTTVTSSANPSTFGQSVTFTATVSPVAPGARTPTGTITFSDGATALGTIALNGNGTAAFITSALAVGSHSITATYSGDPNFTARSGARRTPQTRATLIRYAPD